MRRTATAGLASGPSGKPNKCGLDRYGYRIERGKPAPTNTAAKAIDANSDTRWSSNYLDDSWLQVELAQASPIDHVKIVWPNAAAKKFILQTSLDGVTWTDVETITSTVGPGRTDEITLGVANAKFLRMQGISRWST
ncbi:discoidin domain-containing protein [Arthrobacter sp. lap29]|uniref:discoidin domain-containing protein n=1 Tax=Arthrobacter sp. lap29 TaxID=3056122 RepID=UPI0028F72BBC|nr:discoidin domain-containing protein [Arthrobacter sp. lap29]